MNLRTQLRKGCGERNERTHMTCTTANSEMMPQSKGFRETSPQAGMAYATTCFFCEADIVVKTNRRFLIREGDG